MRTFIALEVPKQFYVELQGLARQLSGIVRGRFVAPQNYHITLAFLGDIDERTVQHAMDALDEACEHTRPVPLASDGLGTFGKTRDATLWLGIRPVDELMNLAANVRDACAVRGIAFDAKPFKPHITLARRASVQVAQLPALAFPDPAIAHEVVLFKSELSSEGATYHPLHTVQL